MREGEKEGGGRTSSSASVMSSAIAREFLSAVSQNSGTPLTWPAGLSPSVTSVIFPCEDPQSESSQSDSSAAWPASISACVGSAEPETMAERRV